MSKVCRRCGHNNDDVHYFCEQCSEPLDENVRLVMDYQKLKKSENYSEQVKPRYVEDDDDYIPTREPEKKSHAVLWLLVIVAIAIIGGAAYLLMSR